MTPMRIPRAVLVRTVLRSFFLQASWNFERLQSLGMLFVIAPALRYLYQGDELSAACRRHLEYFNTHPYMASPVIGTTLSLEQAQKNGETAFLGVQEFKRMIMAPYAAMGDALFWGGIRPIAAGVALFIAAKGSLWAPVVFLILFNLPHLWFRISGFIRGFSMGLKVVEMIQRRRLPDVAVRLKEGTVVLLGGLSAYLTFLCLRGGEIPSFWGIGAIAAVIGLGHLARRGISTLLLVLASSAAVLAFATLWERLIIT